MKNIKLSLIGLLLSTLLFNQCDHQDEKDRIFVKYKHIFTWEKERFQSEDHYIYIENADSRIEAGYNNLYTKLLRLCYCHIDTLTYGKHHQYPVSTIYFYTRQPYYKTTEFTSVAGAFFSIRLNKDNPLSHPDEVSFLRRNGEKNHRGRRTVNFKEAMDDFEERKCDDLTHYGKKKIFDELKRYKFLPY